MLHHPEDKPELDYTQFSSMTNLEKMMDQLDFFGMDMRIKTPSETLLI